MKENKMFNVKTYNPLPKNRARVDKREWLTKKYVKFTPPWVKAQEVIKDFPLEIPNMTKIPSVSYTA